MTRAAEKMCLSPGAVSLQLHNLADELHTQLFVRNGKKLSPTPAALRLAEHARNLVRLTSQIKQEFETDVSTDTRPFHFSTGVTTLIYQLGKPLRQLRQQYPKAEIRVTVNPTEETIEGLHNPRFDLGLVTLPVPEEGLKIMPLFEEELLGSSPHDEANPRTSRRCLASRRSCQRSVSSLSASKQSSANHRSKFPGDRGYPQSRNGSRRYGSDQTTGRVWFWLLCTS